MKTRITVGLLLTLLAMAMVFRSPAPLSQPQAVVWGTVNELSAQPVADSSDDGDEEDAFYAYAR